MFTISISASFTSALSRNDLTCFILSNFCSIHLVSGHRSLYSCIKKAEIIMRAVNFYIQDMGSLKQSLPFLFAFKRPSSFFLAVSPSRQIRKYKTVLKLGAFPRLKVQPSLGHSTTLSSRSLPAPLFTPLLSFKKHLLAWLQNIC